MKKYVLPLALVGVVALQACNQKATEPAATVAPAAPAEEEASTTLALDSSEQRLSYGIAFSLGQRMKTDEVPMDVDAFAAGLRDAIEGAEPRLTQEEIGAEMQAYQEANAAAAATFLAANAEKEGVVVTDSGLQYEIVEEGEGPKPGPDDTVEVHYRGTLADGTEFDSSYARGETVSFGVGQVIPGWTEALQLMPVGSKWKLTIPPELGYGPGGAGQVIGPNAALVFDVELISIAEPEAEETAAEEATDEDE